MATTAPTFVTCPGLCGPTGEPACSGEQVAAHGFDDFDTATVEVDPCSKLLAQGWIGPQLVEYKSRADYLLPQREVTVLRHCDGLVAFAV